MIAPLHTPTLARAWFLITAAVVVVALSVQVVTSATETGGFFEVPAHRALNVFAFFTVQSNVLVAVSALLTGLQPDVDTLLRRALRLTALVAMSVTGVVYHAVLAGLVEMSPPAAFANLLLHTVVPVMAALGWLAFGPRRRTSWRVVGLSAVFPVLWLAFTLIRGPLVGGFWPYPFVDVDDLGRAQVLLNCAVVAVLFVGLAAAAHGLDRLLTRTVRPRHVLGSHTLAGETTWPFGCVDELGLDALALWCVSHAEPDDLASVYALATPFLRECA